MGATLEPGRSAASLRMSQQRRRDTSPELALRRELHRRGLRFRLHRPIPGLPRRTMDIAFVRERLAIFVDGCFWHSCPSHATSPKSNAAWWRSKLARNRERDSETTEQLARAGWRVLRLWEHEVVEDLGLAATQVQAALGASHEQR